MYSRAMLRVCALWVLMTIAASSIWAQPVRLPYRHFTVHDGLPQQQVMCLLQDSRGYIWAGTKGGISKYNGERFENYKNEGVAAGHINQIVEDAKGNIWVGTTTGVGYFDGVRWRKVFEVELTGLMEVDSLMIGYETSTKTIWNLRKDTAVVLRNLENFTLVKKNTDPIITNVTYEQLNIGSAVHLGLNQKMEVVSVDTFINKQYSPIIDSQTKRWSAYSTFSKDNWVRLFNYGESKPYDSIWVESGVSANYMQSFVYPDGSLMVISHTQFYYRSNGQEKATQILLPISSAVYTIMDEEGAIWIGSEGGLYQYFPNGFSFISDEDAPIPWSVYEDSKGLLWISSYGFGLKQFDGKQLRQIALSPYLSRELKMADYFYFGISEDHKGSLYFSHNGGLLKYSNGKWSNVLTEKGAAGKGLGLIPTYSLFDKNRKKVLAGMHRGVYVYDPEKDQLDSIFLYEIPNYIVGLAFDEKDNWWFSSGREGIARYHFPTGNISYFHKGKNGVPLSGALCIEPDPDGGLWFGGLEGLFYFDEKTNHFRQVAPASLSGTVYSLKIVDSLLMIGEGSGLFVLHRDNFRKNGDERVKAYNQFNGYFGIGPKQNCVLLDSKGNYWVGCSNQIATIHKSQINLDDHPSKVRIFQINNERIPFSGSQQITLPSGENEVTIRFESIGFQRPLQTQFSWRVPGFREEWSLWSEDQIAFLSKMPSGDYQFEVRSRHPGAEDSTAYITDHYRFQVSLPFYKEPQFYKYTFFGFGLAVAMGGLMYWLIRKARKETQVAIKMAEERERLIKYYQVQTLQAQLNPHFIFNLLETIQQYVELQKREEAVEQIQRLAKLLRRFLDSSINSDLESIGEGRKEITLATEIELLQYYIELEQIQKPGMFEFSIDILENLQPSNCFVTPMVIQPFVENAIKRGLIPKIEAPRNLWIRFIPHKEGVLCEIEDNGIGMEASRRLQALSDRKYKPRGVSLVRERANLLKELGVSIDINMEDRQEEGTIVTINFANTAG